MNGEERFDIYDEDDHYIGQAARSEVHANGYWHHTFHCWVVKHEAGEDWLLFQKRHPDKDTHPNKFDITAAGHLLAGETVEDGIREPYEELGLAITMDELHPLGIVRTSHEIGAIMDREFCHVHLLLCDMPLGAYHLQAEEVTGLIQLRLQDAIALFQGEVQEVQAVGVERFDEGCPLEAVQYNLQVDDFVPNESYYTIVLNRIKQLTEARRSQEEAER